MTFAGFPLVIFAAKKATLMNSGVILGKTSLGVLGLVGAWIVASMMGYF